ncbi:hypothetical protein GE09DRAFT_1212713 [Coniochaeta sp. 2T2.1]|nr:hypothetical protein GE09DRAFT_1212713 [Coniochaeta sp. 2T2.1]
MSRNISNNSLANFGRPATEQDQPSSQVHGKQDLRKVITGLAGLIDKAAAEGTMDKDVVDILNRKHPDTAKAMELIAEEIATRKVDTSHHTGCLKRITELETEVAELRAGRDAMEHSNKYNWELANERIRALEPILARREEARETGQH